MTILQEIAKGRGNIHFYHKFFVIATANGYDFASSDYVNTSTENFTFFLCWTSVNGKPYFYFCSDPDYMAPNSFEGHNGVAWFKRSSNDRIYHASDTTEQPDMYIELINNDVGDLFIGSPSYTIGDTSSPLYFFKNHTGTTDRGQRLQKNMILNQEHILPINIEYSGSTTLNATTTYLDLDDYVTSGNLSSIMVPGPGNYQGCITNSDGSVIENILIHLIDTESNKISFSRGRGETEPVEFLGTHYVYIFTRNNPDNYDNINLVTGLKSGIKVNLMVEPAHAHIKSFYNLKMAYQEQEFSRQVSYYSNETGKLTNNYPDYGMIYLFLTDNKPDTLTSETLYGGKLILKGTDDRYSDRFFTTAYEANQGVLYRYCGANETCGNCMTGREICYVKANGYQEVADGGEPMTYQIDDSNWNQDNETWNKDFPTYLSYTSYALIGIFMLTYVIWYAVFGTELSTVMNIDRFNNWPREYKNTILAAEITGAFIGAVFLGVFGLMVASAYQPGGNKIFPFVEFNRGDYNPPPGYIFEDSPTEEA